MGCLIALLLWLSPRFVLFLMWLFSERLSIAFESFWVGFAGFLFLPYATVFYALAYAPIRGVTGIGWLFVIIGLLLDFGSLFGGDRQRRQRQAT